MSTPLPDFSDPRFRKTNQRAHAHKIQPSVCTKRETLEQYLARGGSVATCPKDPRPEWSTVTIEPLRHAAFASAAALDGHGSRGGVLEG